MVEARTLASRGLGQRCIEPLRGRARFSLRRDHRVGSVPQQLCAPRGIVDARIA
jgi:hypothetical protein